MVCHRSFSNPFCYMTNLVGHILLYISNGEAIDNPQ